MTCNTNVLKLRTESVLKSQKGCCCLLCVWPESIIKSFNLKLEFIFLFPQNILLFRPPTFFHYFAHPLYNNSCTCTFPLWRERERERERESLETKTPFSNVVEDKRTCKNNFFQKIKVQFKTIFLVLMSIKSSLSQRLSLIVAKIFFLFFW